MPKPAGCACRKPIGWKLTKNPAAIEAEILTLRQQIIVLRRTAPKKQSFGAIDQLVFVGLYRLSLAFLMRLRLLGPRPSSNGTVRASVCTGSRDCVVAAHQFHWKYKD
jgi:hypothetical protein